MDQETALNSSMIVAKANAVEPIPETNMVLKGHVDPLAQLRPTEATDTRAPLDPKEKPTPLITTEEPNGAPPPERNGSPASNVSADESDDKKRYDAGILFLRDKESTDGARFFWRCSQKHRGCPARLHTLAETGEVVLRLHGHVHIGGRGKSLVHRTALDADCAANDKVPAVPSFGRVMSIRSSSMTQDESVTAQNSASKTQATNGTSLESSRKFEDSAPHGSSSTHNNVAHFKHPSNLAAPSVPPVMKSRTTVARPHNICAKPEEPTLKQPRTVAEPSATACLPSTSAGPTHQLPKSPPSGLPESLKVVKRYLQLNPTLRKAADDVFASILDELEKPV